MSNYSGRMLLLLCLLARYQELIENLESLTRGPLREEYLEAMLGDNPNGGRWVGTRPKGPGPAEYGREFHEGLEALIGCDPNGNRCVGHRMPAGWEAELEETWRRIEARVGETGGEGRKDLAD